MKKNGVLYTTYSLVYWVAFAVLFWYGYYEYFGRINRSLSSLGPFVWPLYITAGLLSLFALVYLQTAIAVSVHALFNLVLVNRPVSYEGKHLQSSLYRTARKLERRKDYTGAGEAYESLELWRDAALCFEKGGLLSRAAVAWEKADEPLRAIDLYEAEQNYEAAAAKATAEGLRERALKNYHDAAHKAQEENSYLRSAQFYERAHEFEKAGKVFETLQRTEDALRCYERAGVTYKLESIIASLPPLEVGKRPALSQEVVRRAVEHLVKAEKYVEAAEALAKMGDTVRSAEIYEMAEMFDLAGEAYFQAGQVERAKAAYAKVDDEKKMSDFLARLAMMNGDWKNAGMHFESADKPNQAVEAYKRAKDFVNAGNVYRKINRHLMAGEMFSAGREFQLAGESYSDGHDWRNAAECFMESGDFERAMGAHISAGNYFQAGNLAIKLQDYAKAIECFQRVAPTSTDAKAANGFLAVAFARQGRTDMARELMRRVIDQIPPSADTLIIFYEYGKIIEAENAPGAVAVYQRIMGVNTDYEDVADRITRLQDPALLALQSSPAAAAQAITGSDTLTSIGGERTVNTQMVTETIERQRPVTATGETRFGDEGRYRILHEIGRGGMATVYKAIDQVLEREVALKTFPLSRNSGPGREDIFLNEARLIARLSHPNIVTIYDSGHMNFLYYIAMEYVQGENLKQVVKRKGPLSMEEIRSVFRQLADALVYAHTEQVLHRDIKPANIIVRGNSNIKVVDFGLAKILTDASTKSIENEDSQRTLVGTPQYMAPEQILGGVVDARTDVYAMGLTLFYAVTGRTPFDVRRITDPLEISRMQLHSSFPRPSTLRATLSAALDDVFVKCTQKNPTDRYSSVSEFLAEFEKL